MASPTSSARRLLGLVGITSVALVGCPPTAPSVPTPPSPPSAQPPPTASAPAPQASAAQPAPAKVPLGPFPARPRELYESYGDKYMAVTQGDASTRAARKMFELGGNVIDAAAAASF